MPLFSPRRSIIVQTAVVYALVIGLVIVATLVLDESIGLHHDTRKSIYQFCFASAFLVFLFAWEIEPVAKPDRTIMLVRLLWIYAGWILFFVFYFVLYGFFGRTGTIAIDLLLLGLFGIAGLLWQSVSSPFARAWALEKCADRDRMLRAESRVSFPFSPSETEGYEIRISPAIYYGLISATAVIVVIVADAVFGEFLDRRFPLPGYSGAIAIALVVAAAMYPFHTRVSKFVSPSSQRKFAEAPSETTSGLPAILSSVARMLRLLLIKHRFFAFLWVVLASLFAWLAVLYLPNFILSIAR